MNWYKTAKVDQTEIQALQKSLMERYPGIDLELWLSSNGYIELAVIEVPKDQQNKGIGNAIVSEVKTFAQSLGFTVVLRPSASYGKKQALERFYKNLDFVKNKGRNIDFELSSPVGPTMYWKPTQEDQV